MKTPAKTLLALLLGATVLASAVPSFAQSSETPSPPAAEQPDDMPGMPDMAEGGEGWGWGWWGHGKGHHGHGDGHGRGGHGEGRGGQGGRMMQIIDANADGVIGDDEAASRVEGVFYAMDADSSGDITEAEFMAVRMGPGEGRNPERQAQMQERKKARFVEMDADKDGKVTKEQFLAAGKARFAAADTDKDGKVNPWEFRSQHMN